MSNIAEPTTRCVIIALVLTVSTGALIRQLIRNTFYDIVVFVIGLLWLMGDLIPCIALFVLAHDVLISYKWQRTQTGSSDPVVLTVRGKTYSLLDVIILSFSIMYMVDVILNIICNISSFNTTMQSRGCMQALSSYRQTFFHIQVIVALLYLLRHWKWQNFDLRAIINKLDRLFGLLQKMLRSYGAVLQSGTSRFVPQQIEGTQLSLRDDDAQPNTISHEYSYPSVRYPSLMPETETSVVENSLRAETIELDQSGTAAHPTTSSDATARNRSVTRRNQRRGAASRTTSRGRRSTSRGRCLTGCGNTQIVLRRATGAARGRGSRRLGSRPRTHSMGLRESTRTVNLNFHMN